MPKTKQQKRQVAYNNLLESYRIMDASIQYSLETISSCNLALYDTEYILSEYDFDFYRARIKLHNETIKNYSQRKLKLDFMKSKLENLGCK